MTRNPKLLDQLLHDAPWMPDLPAELSEMVHRETLVRRVEAQGFVCRKGEEVTAWIGVASGLVKISTVSSEGRLVTFTGVSAGGWLGEGPVLKDEPDATMWWHCAKARLPFCPSRSFARCSIAASASTATS
jgi:CRP-like cAMP-binding protein